MISDACLSDFIFQKHDKFWFFDGVAYIRGCCDLQLNYYKEM
jgi:hypothetical protein